MPVAAHGAAEGLRCRRVSSSTPTTESRKGLHLLAHPKAALLFHWKSLRRQVRLEGPVSPTTPEEADAYFATRARGSQIGAWASDQSRPLESRFALEKRVAEVTAPGTSSARCRGRRTGRASACSRC